jgi:exosome complex component CSL4
MSERVLKDVVVPGEEIGVIEEFLPGEGTYVDGNSVRSMMLGTAVLDVSEKRVRVYPLIKRGPLAIERDDVVLGEVVGMKKDIAVVLIRKIEGKNLVLNKPLHGVLHISQVSDKFVEFLFDMIRVTDILRAKVINSRPPYQLSIKERGLGVVAAFCPNCQTPMIIKNRKLYCPKCRVQEERKLSVKYSTNLKL